ncbi:MAG: hypothetical protein MUC34_05510 [Anaerolineae bacterium]|nr:hypothetical protein [Anaerolineae bacterium]
MLKKTGSTAAMAVVAKAEFAQSYMTQALTGRRTHWRGERTKRGSTVAIV